MLTLNGVVAAEDLYSLTAGQIKTKYGLCDHMIFVATVVGDDVSVPDDQRIPANAKRLYSVIASVRAGPDVSPTEKLHGSPTVPTSSKAVSGEVAPPLSAQKLLSLVAGPKRRDEMLGDMREQYQKQCARFGPAYAVKECWVDVLCSIAPLILQRTGRFVGLTCLGELCRRLLRL